MFNHKTTRGVYERSVSLSLSVVSKSAPTSPGLDKKNVHFAEGEALVNVKTYVPSYDDLDALRKVFLHEIPLKTGKNAAKETDDNDNDGEYSRTAFKKLKGSSTLLTKSFRIVHTSNKDHDCLSALYDKVEPDELDDRLKKNNVCLSDTKLNGRSVNGFVIVNNLAYDKLVVVRHTFDDWNTVLDVPAYYISSSDEGKRDKFGFNLVFPQNRSEMYFALQYSVDGLEFWDNNHGNNYKIVNFS